MASLFVVVWIGDIMTSLGSGGIEGVTYAGFESCMVSPTGQIV